MKRWVSLFLIMMIIFSTAAISEEISESFGFLQSVLSWIQNPVWKKTYTVKYFDETGEEIFPAFENDIYVQQLLYGITFTDEELACFTVDQKRATYFKGDEVYDYPVPLKEGYVGQWDQELPDVMDGRDYELHAVYTIGQYTLMIWDGQDMIYEYTAAYGDSLDLSHIKLPDAPEGYTAEWSEPLPDSMPGFDTLIMVVYREIAE